VERKWKFCGTVHKMILDERKTWPLMLREENRLKVFENWVLRAIFGPKREE
jgi:hypothetical protein